MTRVVWNRKCVWSDAQIQTLAELWGQGRTANDIARTMGITRNQVIGKAHRLNLNKRADPIIRDMDPQIAERNRKKRSRENSRKQYAKHKEEKSSVVKIRKRRTMQYLKDPGFDGRKDFYTNLGAISKQCQHIEGARPIDMWERLKNPPTFCPNSAVRGRSYCAEHCASHYEWHQFIPGQRDQSAA